MTPQEIAKKSRILFLIGVVLFAVGSYALFGLPGLGGAALIFGVLFMLTASLGRPG